MKNFLLAFCFAFCSGLGLDCHAQDCDAPGTIGLTQTEQNILINFGSALSMAQRWGAMELTINGVNAAYSIVNADYSGLVNSFSNLINESGVLDLAISAFNTASNAITSVATTVTNSFTNLQGDFQNLLNESGVLDTAISAFNTTSAAITSVFTTVSSSFTNLQGDFQNLLNQSGILDGVISTFNTTTISAEATALATDIGIAGVNSEVLSLGIQDFFLDGAISTFNAAVSFFNSMMSGVNSGISAFWAFWTNAGNTFGDWWDAGWDFVFGSGMVLVDYVGNPFSFEAVEYNDNNLDADATQPLAALTSSSNGGGSIGTEPQPSQSQDSYTVANFSETDSYHNPIIIHPIFDGEFFGLSLVDFNANNIDNTPDILKPISLPQQNELSKFPTWATAPLSSSDFGAEGAIAFDENYFYTHVDGVWCRQALSAW